MLKQNNVLNLIFINQHIMHIIGHFGIYHKNERGDLGAI
jgi:hypothetical protein